MTTPQTPQPGSFPEFEPRILKDDAPRGASVIVIGAGMAGLSAAYQLVQAGHDVTVLEARRRVGGKVQTKHSRRFHADFQPEAGALLIPGYHTLTIGYAQELGLELKPVGLSSREGVAYIRGTRVPGWIDGNAPWPASLGLTDAERSKGWLGLWQEYVTSASSLIGDPRAPGWPDARVAELDRISFATFLRKQGASEPVIEILRLGMADTWGDGIDTVSALAHLAQDALEDSGRRQNTGKPLQRNQFIPGGNARLADALAQRIGSRIVPKAAVCCVEESRGKVVVRCRDGRTFTADRAICAVPFTTLRRIKLPPTLSAEKRRAINLLQHTSVTRMWVQTTTPIWTDPRAMNGVHTNGMIVSDLPIMFVSVPSAYFANIGKGMLDLYITGRYARALSAMGFDEALKLVTENLEKVFPGIAQQVEAGTWVRWDKAKWSRGAFPTFMPGDMTSFFPHAARPEGLLHFAGEQTSVLPGWMQGAFESGHRAASEVHRALGGTTT